MKLLFILLLTLFSHLSYAQLDLRSVSDHVSDMNKNKSNTSFNYDESTNTVTYQMFFSDKESFKVFSHFKSANIIFEDKLEELNKNGLLDKIIALGVNDIILAIKSEETGNILVSKDIYPWIRSNK